MIAFFVSSVMFGMLLVIRVNVDGMKNQDQYSLIDVYSTQKDMAAIYFDRSIYYPDVRVFWESNASVPIEIRVVDRDVNDNYVKVKVSSSIDSKEVTLTKNVLGVFSGKVFAVGIGLMGEPISNTSNLNVKYGDEIIAKYFDMSSGNNLTASALFVFPSYVINADFNNPEGWESASNVVFDSEGIPMVNYYGTIGLQYNPVTISQYALANYYTYLNGGNVTRREKFLAQAKWLVENAKQKGNYSVWELNFDYPSYGVTKPWVSAMAQGQGLSVLARAYVLTENISYIDVAEKIILAFQVEMSVGGVRYTDSNGVWFEEYADVGAPSSKVLNGFIYALLGLYEYSFETNNSKGWTFFKEGTETLSNNIYRYDSGSWSYLDLLYYNTASLSYHKTHIEQLRTLYELTGDEIFLYYSDKFQSYISPPPPPPPPTPENTLVVYTLPSGVTFTVNNVPHMAPWSGAYENGTLVSLVMPETLTLEYLTCCWDQWSDGNTNRSRTFTMDTNITVAAYFESSRLVGGISIPVNKLGLLAPYIELAISLALAVVTAAYAKKIKRCQ
jgi:heparosan-N-sulfate-glucuronate 5-epimerase